MKIRHPLPPEVYAAVETAPATVLLESSRAGAGESLSSLFVSPVRVIEATCAADLRALFDQIEQATRNGLYAAGFFAYECGQLFEPKVKAPVGPLRHPLAWFGIYERAYRFDHTRGAFLDGDPPVLASVIDSGTQTEQISRLELAPSLSEREYADKIDQIHEWIRAGDVYQLNFTFPLGARIAERPSTVYERLRRRQPVDYGAFVHWRTGRRILCFSPELFFRAEEAGSSRRITTQPMKGTAPRGRNTTEDREVADWLRNDEKNRSENVMIVDLIRNDLGRLCEFGTVRAESLFSVERYPTLWQMTSTVTGELRSDAGYYDVFRALFPCGSITGAPKVRAMQLLTEIEREPRGVYTGAIGFFSRERTVFNVAIRTLDLDGEDATMGVGGGIVIDSTAEEEFRECKLKAEFLSRADEPFSLIETLLWRGGYPLLDLHLDRLADSAEYFGFSCDREQVKARLVSVASVFADDSARKVRLLLDSDGSLHIEHEMIPEPAGQQGEPGRVCIARERTDPGDRFLFHKTTHRTLYASALKAASETGFADVLFLNTRGEVTEGAINNVFIEKQGRWITPPVGCGLLAGVFRRHLLETRSNVEEGIIRPDDLLSADAIYLTNAVRGVRRVILDHAPEIR
jgi:para-aminobenzoate synthetase / 4-amino-4-deoxychorismate lyase